MSQHPLLTEWDAQPQESVGIDPAHPLARLDWRLVYVPGQLPFGSANAGLPTAVGSGSVRSTGSAGQAFGINAEKNADYWSWGANSALQLSTFSGVAVFSIDGSTVPVNLFNTGISSSGSGLGGLCVNLSPVGGSAGIAKNDLVALLQSTGSIKQGINVVAWSWDNTNAVGSISLNGDINTTPLAGSQTFNHGTVISSGYYTNVNAFAPGLAKLFFLAVSATPINATQVGLLSRNPWQLFAPIPVPTNIYTPPPAPTGKRYRQIVSGWDSQPQGGAAIDRSWGLSNYFSQRSGILLDHLAPDAPATRTALSTSVSARGVDTFYAGTTSRFGAGRSLFSNLNTWTAIVRWRVTSFTGGQVIYEGGSGSNNISIASPASTTGTLALNVGSNTNRPSNKASWVVGQWYTTAVVCSSAGVLLYIDGVLDSTTGVATLSTASAGFSIGSYDIGAYGSYFGGDIGPVQIYQNVALTGAQIKSLYDNEWQLFEPLTTNAPIYTPPAGVPLLSSPTLSSITQTTSRPQVSITFP